MSILRNLTSITSKKAKRVGRGYGSGKGGHTAGRGQKGQGSRTGFKNPVWFEGGQLPLSKRMPMIRGKGRLNVVNPTAQISLTELSKVKASTVSLETLKLEKVIDSKFKKAKIINTGKLTKKVSIKGLACSAGAKEAIEKAGGSVIA